MQAHDRGQGTHASRWQPYTMDFGGLGKVILVSVYGYSADGAGPKNRGLLREISEWAAERKGSAILYGGDWNMTAEQWYRAGGHKLGAMPITRGRPRVSRAGASPGNWTTG